MKTLKNYLFIMKIINNILQLIINHLENEPKNENSINSINSTITDTPTNTFNEE